MSEKELLSGKIAGTFYHPPLMLTSKRLILGERSISLNEILKADSKKEKTQSKMVIYLKNGKIEEITIAPEKTASAPTSLSGNINTQDYEMKIRPEATTEKWVNIVNSCLSVEETKEITNIPIQEPPPSQPVTEQIPVNYIKDEERIAHYFKIFSIPSSESDSQSTFEDSGIAKRLRTLKGLLEEGLITKKDFEKRKKEILSEI